MEKTAAHVSMLSVMDTYKKSVDFYNSFGMSKTKNN
jgi:hypothetical protein